MKRVRSFTSKKAIEHVRTRVALSVAVCLWLSLLTFPNHGLGVGASHADAESTNSLELVATQTVSYTAAATSSPAAPFTMIIMNDPQFPWPSEYDSNGKPEFSYEQWHKVNTINKIYHGNWFKNWPSRSELGNNYAFDRDMQYSPVPPLEGVIINGDLTYCSITVEDDWVMKGMVATDWPNWRSLTPRNWFYRDYYVTWLSDKNHCPGLSVYAGFGNHDSKWTIYDLACALTLNEDSGDPNQRRYWKNFPKKSSFWDIDFEEKADGHWEGSLAYSWEVGNYHFVQANNIVVPGPGGGDRELDLGSKWLDDMVVTSSLEWLEDDIKQATTREKRIVLNMHYWQCGWPKIEAIINGTNTVAVFVGHQIRETGMYSWNSWRFNDTTTPQTEINNAWNAFKQRIPVFQAGHSGYKSGTGWCQDNELLIVECADDYMNVGLAYCGDWDDEACDPRWYDPRHSRLMRTIKWSDNTPPSVTWLIPRVQPIYEGEYKRVAWGNFTDDPCLWDSWYLDVDYGDNLPHGGGFLGEGWGSECPFPVDAMRHAYEDNGIYDITVTITDLSDDESDSDTCKLTVLNRDPTVKTVDLSCQRVFEGAPVTVTALFTDPGVSDTHTSTVAWGDESSDPGTVDEHAGSGKVNASHIYSAPGSYNVTVTVFDDDGGVASKAAEIDVIVALSGFVTDEYHNKPLAGVTITCNGETTTTDVSGYYEITPLNPGDYSVNMTKLGYNSIVPIKTATITAGQETIVNFTAYPLPNITVTKATADTERLAGDTITYHITVENQGDGPATNVVITDVLPSMTTLISVDPPATAIVGRTLTWSIGNMSEHTSATIELTVRISLLVYADAILSNSVTVAFNDWYALPQTPETASATTVILPTVPTENVQGIGYWRRQIKAVLNGKSCDYTESELYLLFEKIRVSSQVYDFYYSLENVSDIILAQPTGKDTMETRATQQLFVLWLNVAARAVAADTSLDLADVTTATTIAEALTQCEALLRDPARTKATCECSKEICDLLNNGHGLPW